MRKNVLPEQEAIPYLKTLLFIASIDGSLSDNEIGFFSMEGAEVGLQSKEIETAINWIKVRNEPLETIVKGLHSKEAKTLLISRLLELCYLDGDYSLPERSGMDDLCALIDFDFKEFHKLEGKAELNYRMKNIVPQMKDVGNNALGKFSKAFEDSKKGSEQLGKKIVDGSSNIAHSVASGIGAVGSKISFTFENAKKAKKENKELRERLQKESVTEAVKQKVVMQLYSKIQALGNQLKEEKKRNDQNEELIRLLQEQIADLEATVDVAENVETA